MNYNIAYRPTHNFYVIETPNTMMLDWDLPSLGHHDASITVQSRKAVYEILDKWVKSHPEYYFRVYNTPGGVHAWCLSHSLSALDNTSWGLMEELDVDPLYIDYTQNRGSYACRVSAKKRKNDYIARYSYSLGWGKLLEEQTAVVREHDRLIQLFRAKLSYPKGIEMGLSQV